MADHPHTIDRWDDVTGENLIRERNCQGQDRARDSLSG